MFKRIRNLIALSGLDIKKDEKGDIKVSNPKTDTPVSFLTPKKKASIIEDDKPELFPTEDPENI